MQQDNHQTTSSSEPTETTRTEQAQAPADKPRRKLSLTDKLTEMRDSHVKALRQLRDREVRHSLDLERIRSERQKREDELRRLNTTLPAEMRVAPESISLPGEQAEANRDPGLPAFAEGQSLGQAQ
jgi:hypothetical protein